MQPEYYYPALYIWIMIGLGTFILLFRVTAPYGRHSSFNWGPLINNRLGWLLMELPALLVFDYFFISGSAPKNMVLWIFFALWNLHYGHRALIFPFMLKTGNKKMPLIIAVLAVAFNIINTFFIGYYLGNMSSHYSIAWLSDPRFLGGLILFLSGMAINLHADYTLINIRKPGETGYKIPMGGMFRYVSCPNHLGEMMEWLGYALLTWCLPALAFFLWTFFNVFPRSFAHHRWYKEQFPDYPRERKILIPGIL